MPGENNQATSSSEDNGRLEMQQQNLVSEEEGVAT